MAKTAEPKIDYQAKYETALAELKRIEERMRFVDYQERQRVRRFLVDLGEMEP